jgi:hypothetical protein
MYIRLIPHYLLWHYTLGIRDYCVVAQRLLRAVAHIFSLSLMLRTFFQPFERLGEHYSGGGIQTFFETFIVTTLMRLVGMAVRSCILIVGVVALICACAFVVCGICVWIVLPFLPLIALYASILNLVKLV